MKLLLGQFKKIVLLKMLKLLRNQWILLRFIFSLELKEMNLENSVSDLEKCTIEKVAVVFKWEAGKDVKTDTNT